MLTTIFNTLACEFERRVSGRNYTHTYTLSHFLSFILFAQPFYSDFKRLYVSMVQRRRCLTLLFDCYKMHNGTHNGWIVDFVLLLQYCRYHAQHAGAAIATATVKKVNITRYKRPEHTFLFEWRKKKKTQQQKTVKVFMTNKSNSQWNFTGIVSPCKTECSIWKLRPTIFERRGDWQKLNGI